MNNVLNATLSPTNNVHNTTLFLTNNAAKILIIFKKVAIVWRKVEKKSLLAILSPLFVVFKPKPVMNGVSPPVHNKVIIPSGARLIILL